jgi:hypothetical protein
MRDRHVQFGGTGRSRRRATQQILIQRDRPRVVAEAHSGGCVQRPVLAIGRIDRQQLVELGQGLLVLVPSEQH